MVGIAAASILDVADDELALRVCGPTRHGQIVRLRSRKCTIGSGPRCTLRLRARGVQPLHCLILRGAEATVIRRFSADTRINGRAFTDAPLTPGDRLSIGPIEFEVVDADRLSEREAGRASPVPKSYTPPARPETDKRQQAGADPVTARQLARARTRRMIRALRSAREEIANLQQQQKQALRQKENALQERSEGLDRAQAELESERQAFDQERSSWEGERAASASTSSQKSDEVEARLAELDSQREAFEQDLKRRENERTEAEQTLRRRREELDTRRAELEAQQEALQQERRQWTDQQGEALRKLHARANELDHRHAELDSAREELDHRRDQWDAQRVDAERKVQERSEELAERAQELDAQADELHARQSELEARQNEIEGRQTELDSRGTDLDSRQTELEGKESEINEKWQRWQAEQAAVGGGHEESSRPADQEQDLQFEQPTGGSPGSAEAALRRLGIAPAFDDGETEDPATPSPLQAGNATKTRESQGEPEAEEDESIDDYMARLLDRVRQTPGPGGEPTRPGPSPQAPSPRPRPPQAPPEPTDSPSPAMEPTDSPPPTPAPAAEPPESPGLSRRAVAPERSVDLSAMRDLANLSAQAAIDRHARTVLATRSAGKLMVAAVSLLAGAALLGIWWAKSPGLLPLYAGAASLGISILFGGQYLLLGARLLLAKRGRADSKRDSETAAQTEERAEGSGHTAADTGEQLRSG